MTSPEADGGPRERILALVRHGAEVHAPSAHPGSLPKGSPPAGGALEEFARRLTAAGGEVVMLATMADVEAWLDAFAAGFATAATSPFVPPRLRPRLTAAEPHEAALGVSVARSAAAESGSLVLDSREGRRLQLLVPVHLVWLGASQLYDTLDAALTMARNGGGAALALHSGPSKSADIGGVLVRGVHGPGRLVAAIVPDALLAANADRADGSG